VVTSNFEAQAGDIVITKASIHKIMRKPNPLTNIEDDQKVDSDLVKRLAKAFEVLEDLEE
jgi:hypothetical protein